MMTHARCHRMWRWLVTVSLGVLNLGCESHLPLAEIPAFPMPTAYRNAVSMHHAVVRSELSGEALWANQYGSVELDRLVDQSLANNTELRIATLQIAQNRVRAQQTRAGSSPLVTLPVSIVTQGGNGNADTQKATQLSLQGSWRPDVWGESKWVSESADLQLWRAIFERENIQRGLIGSLVSVYVGYIATNDAIESARENERIASTVLDTMEKRVALGDATTGELEQQRAALLIQQAVIPSLENQREDFRNQMARLIGTTSDRLALTDKGLDELQMPAVNASLPAALLLHRPDIRMVEARMRAANADIEVARARLLPPIDLSAQIGYSGLAIANFIQPQNLFWNAVSAMTVSIFDGGRKEGDKVFAQAYYEEMVATYGQTLFQAVKEVESALSNVRTARLRLDAQRAATRSTLHSFKIASDAYTLGALDLTSYWESRKNYQRNVEETQRIKAELLRAYASLSQALGSGDVANQSFDAMGHSGADVLLGQSEMMIDGAWEAELPGLFHRSALAPAWRDLKTRFAVAMKDHGLRGWFQGSFNGKPEHIEAWYRLTVPGFVTSEQALAFCHALAEQQQGCRAVAVPSRRSSKIASAP